MYLMKQLISSRIFFVFFTLLFVAPSLAAEMTFRGVSNGGNFYNCCWTIAEGEITKRTPLIFQQFIDEQRKQNSSIGEIRINGFGDDIAAGIELGHLIRDIGAATTVGDSKEYFSPWYERVESGQCVAACAYAFLGGRVREIPSYSRLGFSQFHDTSAFFDNETKTVSGRDRELRRVNDQILTGQIVQFLSAVDVSASLYTLAASVEPGSGVRYLTDIELTDLRIDTKADFGSPWAAVMVGNRISAETTTRNSNRTLRLYCANERTYALDIEVENGDFEGIKSIAGDKGTIHSLVTSAGKMNFQTWSVSKVSGTNNVRLEMVVDKTGALAVANSASIRPVSSGLPRVVANGLHMLFEFDALRGDKRLPARILEIC